MTFEDGTPITCADVKYGVSRTFATDVITDGPTYAISMLDIPTDKDGNSVYKGPYVTKGNDHAAFDKAVECTDDKTVVFHLNPAGRRLQLHRHPARPSARCPKSADTGEKYDDKPVSSGPYKIQSYDKGSQLVLVRNENWTKETDDYRRAHPDKIVVKFGLETTVIDQRLIQDSGEDQHALTFGDTIDPSQPVAPSSARTGSPTGVPTSSTPSSATSPINTDEGAEPRPAQGDRDRDGPRPAAHRGRRRVRR